MFQLHHSAISLWLEFSRKSIFFWGLASWTEIKSTLPYKQRKGFEINLSLRIVVGQLLEIVVLQVEAFLKFDAWTKSSVPGRLSFFQLANIGQADKWQRPSKREVKTPGSEWVLMMIDFFFSQNSWTTSAYAKTKQQIYRKLQTIEARQSYGRGWKLQATDARSCYGKDRRKVPKLDQEVWKSLLSSEQGWWT